MQEKNEKIFRVMAANDSNKFNSGSLTDLSQVEAARGSKENVLNSIKLTIESTLKASSINRRTIAKDNENNIDKTITALENRIKHLHDRIIEMSAANNKSVPVNISEAHKEESNIGASFAAPEMTIGEKEPESNISFPIIPENCIMLKDQIKLCATNVSNIINADDEKDALDDVRKNFSMLWNDTTKTSKSNLDLVENSKETVNINLSNECRFCVLQSPLQTDKQIFENDNSIASVESDNNKAQIELTNAAKFFEGACPNDKVSSDDIRDDEKILSSNNEISTDFTDNDVISEIVYENIADKNTIDNVLVFNVETCNNLPAEDKSMTINEGNIKNYPKHLVNTSDSKHTVTDLPNPRAVAAITTNILETTGNLTANSSQTLSVNPKDTVPKTDSIFRTFNRKFCEFVGIFNEKPISQEKNNSEDNFTSNKDLSNEKFFGKDFPRSKSEPKKDFSTSEGDSTNICPRNTVIPLTQAKPNTSNSSNNNVEEENSSGFIEIVKKIIPTVLNSGLPDKNDNNLPNHGITKEDLIKGNLKMVDNVVDPVNTANDPQIINPVYEDDISIASIKNPDPNFESDSSSGLTSTLPNYFGSDFQTDNSQLDVAKVEVGEKKEEITEDDADEAEDDNDDYDKNVDDDDDEEVDEDYHDSYDVD